VPASAVVASSAAQDTCQHALAVVSLYSNTMLCSTLNAHT
jgi:hypothetical protein